MTQLTTNTTNLQTILDTVNALPDAGAGEDVTAETETYTNLLTDLEAAVDALPDAGSGGSVETCTLSTGANNTLSTSVVCTTYKNGEFDVFYATNTAGANTVIADNVVKDSFVAFGNKPGDVTDALEYMSNTLSFGNLYKITGDATFNYYICFARDTLIALANGTTKPVQNIAYADLLLVWDFDNGCYAAAHPLWIKQEQKASYYYRCSFDNGTVLRLVGSGGKCHRVFSLDRNAFESATECVGERIMTKNGVARLLSCERIEEDVDFYNIITDKHINLYAEGVLTSCRLNNLYPIEDMRFVKDGRELLPLDAYNGVEADFYNGLRLAEQKSEDVEMLNGYVANLYKHKA